MTKEQLSDEMQQKITELAKELRSKGFTYLLIAGNGTQVDNGMSRYVAAFEGSTDDLANFILAVDSAAPDLIQRTAELKIASMFMPDGCDRNCDSCSIGKDEESTH